MHYDVLITGGKGFIARSLTPMFRLEGYDVYSPTHQELDVSNKYQVDEFFKKNTVDIVIHTAVKGGNRTDSESYENLQTNLLMFENLLNNKESYRLLFTFGSGAEFDRRFPILRVCEENIFKKHPIDAYGLAKNIICRRIYEETYNVINLRLFGCFGPLEENFRLIKNNVQRAINGEYMVIHQDKFMDYFFINDVYKVIQYIMTTVSNVVDYNYKSLNLSYMSKYRLSDIATSIAFIVGKPNLKIHIETGGWGMPYTGNGSMLSTLNLPLTGLENGILEMYESMMI